MKYCNNCGKEISDNAKFCKHCGAKIEASNDVTLSNNDLVIKESPTPVELETTISKQKVEKPQKRKSKSKNGHGKQVAGNVLWLIFGGAIWGVALIIVAVGCFITLIGIPAGFQYMKTAKFVFSPFGKEKYVVKKGFFRTFANIIWCFSLGLASWLSFIIFGAILCITIIGIPFGKQYFKLAGFIIWPYGRDFRLANK